MALERRTVRRVATVALLVCLSVTGMNPPAAEAATVSEIRDGLEAKINRARASRGLRKLRVNVTTQKYAQGHATHMGDLNAMFHDAALWHEVPAGAEWLAENVGYVSAGSRVVRRMHRAYMNSDGHRANILKPRATHMGIGVVKRDGKVWTVERFVDLW